MTDPHDERHDPPGRRPGDGVDARELEAALAHAEGAAPPPGDAVAARVHTALDRTRDDLARHGDDLVRDAPALPPAVLARVDRALAAERADGRTVAPAPSPSRRRRGLLAGAVAAALALLLTVAGLGRTTGSDTPPPRATDTPTRVEPPPGPAPGPDRPRLGEPDVGVVALRAALGRAEFGPLSDPSRRAACLAAHGVPPGTVPAGAREVVWRDRPAVLFVLTTGVAARFRVLVVEPACAADRPLTLADRIVGR